VRNANCVARFEEFERSLGVDAEDRVLNVRVGRGIGAARNEFVARVNVLGCGSADGGALHHDHVAGLRHGEVGLGGDNHSERLKVREGFDVRIAVVIERQFAEVDGASFGRDGPENVGQELESELGSVFESGELGFNCKVGLFAFDLGFARGPLEEIGAAEIDLAGATLQAIVHRLGGTRHGRGRGV
jgi:hypothetical protein